MGLSRMRDEMEYKHYTDQWHRVFAWWPVTTVRGKRIWLKFIYRRSYSAISGHGYDYATVFDMMDQRLLYPFRY